MHLSGTCPAVQWVGAFPLLHTWLCSGPYRTEAGGAGRGRQALLVAASPPSAQGWSAHGLWLLLEASSACGGCLTARLDGRNPLGRKAGPAPINIPSMQHQRTQEQAATSEARLTGTAGGRTLQRKRSDPGSAGRAPPPPLGLGAARPAAEWRHGERQRQRQLQALAAVEAGLRPVQLHATAPVASAGALHRPASSTASGILPQAVQWVLYCNRHSSMAPIRSHPAAAP